MIYDCFIFNDELELLLLRLEFLSAVVDKFVLVEAEYSFSGHRKPLYYQANQERFRRFRDRIIHLPVAYEHYLPGDAWANEYFQRNYIKTGLASLHDDDIVHIADVDEIPDLPAIFQKYHIDKPCLVELPVYNYFFNLRSRASFKVNLLTPYHYIRETHIGNREHYRLLTDWTIDSRTMRTGWHFSYLFGFDIARYQGKLRSFSHQEFNTPYFLDEKRLRALLSLRADILERNSVLTVVNIDEAMGPALRAAMARTGLGEAYFYQRPALRFFLRPYHLRYYLRFSVKPRLKLWLVRLTGK